MPNTNGNHARQAQKETNKHAGALLGVKRVPAERNQTKGGDGGKASGKANGRDSR